MVYSASTLPFEAENNISSTGQSWVNNSNLDTLTSVLAYIQGEFASRAFEPPGALAILDHVASISSSMPPSR